MSETSYPKSEQELLQRLQIARDPREHVSKELLVAAILPDEVKVDMASRTILYRYTLEPWMQNCNRVLHGGMAATLLDLSCGLFVRAWSGRMGCVTSNLNISYLRPVNMDQPYYVRVRIESCGKNLSTTHACAWQDKGEDALCNTANATFFLKD